MALTSETRHARACPGHPRLNILTARKTWMAGTSPAMTVNERSLSAGKFSLQHLFKNLPADGLVGQRSFVPPPAVRFHFFGPIDKSLGHLGKIRVGIFQAQNQSPRT